MVFEGLGDRDVHSIFSLAPVKVLEEGDVLIKEGETGDNFFVILEGRVKVTKDTYGTPQQIADLEQGDWLGEIAFSRQVRRTATAMAVTRTRVLSIDRGLMEQLAPNIQIYFLGRLNDLATERIAELTAREEELARKNRQLAEYIQRRGPSVDEYGRSAMIRGILGTVTRLPPFAARLVQKLIADQMPLADMTEKIKEHPAWPAKIVETANSEVYALPRKATDMNDAVAMLGRIEVYQMILAESMGRVFPQADTFQAFHDQSRVVAHLSLFLSQESGLISPELAATTGMYHNIGQGVALLLKEDKPNLSLVVQSLDLNQIGALLLREWDMPPIVARSVENQIRPEFSPPEDLPDDIRNSLAILYLSRMLFERLTDQRDDRVPMTFLNDYLALMGWPGRELKDILGQKVLPGLARRMNTYPLCLREILDRKLGKGKGTEAG